MPLPYRSPRRTLVAAAIASGSILIQNVALATEDFEDCAIVHNSIASPFIQSRTQLAILNFEIARGNPCNLIEFRIADVTSPPDVTVKDDVQTSRWEERWGVRMCQQNVAYHIWYTEIGLGGISFHVEREDNAPRAFFQRIESGAAVAAPAVETQEAAAEPAPDSTKVAEAAQIMREEDVAGTGPEAALPPAPVTQPVLSRTLKMAKPLMKGQDVCAVQRALMADGIDVLVDGIFGPGLKKAVSEFQKTNGIEKSGVVDDPTWTALAFREIPVAEETEPDEAPEKDE